MFRTRKTIAAIGLLAFAAASHATIFGGNTENNYDNRTYNQGGSGGSAEATAAAVAAQAQLQGQLQGQQQRTDVKNANNIKNVNDVKNANDVRNANSVEGSEQEQHQTLNNAPVGSGNTTSMIFEKSAPSVAVGMQSAPTVDCRRTLGVGASSPGGSGVVSGFPLWKEADCVVTMAVQVMNSSGVFGMTDKQRVACQMSLVEDLKVCKDLKEADKQAARASAILNGRQEQQAANGYLP